MRSGEGDFEPFNMDVAILRTLNGKDILAPVDCVIRDRNIQHEQRRGCLGVTVTGAGRRLRFGIMDQRIQMVSVAGFYG